MEIGTERKLYGLLSHLLQYPDDEWRRSLPDVRAETERCADREDRTRLIAFLDKAESSDPLEWQYLYVRTFDFGKKTNLYLTYGQYGDEGERGPALIELKRCYREAGYEPDESELPDYLPLMLEFSAVAAQEAVRALWADKKKALETIRDELKRSDHPYAPLFELILRMVSGPVPAAEMSLPGREER